MAELPTGTVTFLFTDIEGGGAAFWPRSGQRRGPDPGTRRWEQHPEAMRLALARHDALLRHAIATHAGQVFKTMGDQFCAAFATAPDALAAALTAQQALQDVGAGGAEGAFWGKSSARSGKEKTGPGLVGAPPDAEGHPQGRGAPKARFGGRPPGLRVRMALHTGAAEQRDGDYFGPALNRVARLLAVGHGDQILLSAAAAEAARAALAAGASLRDLGSHRLKDLQQPEHAFQLLHPDLPADFPPLRLLAAFAHNLPVQLTSFIGREPQIAEVKRLLAATHLLTLTGSGGMQ